jgi:hypothetical protein
MPNGGESTRSRSVRQGPMSGAVTVLWTAAVDDVFAVINKDAEAAEATVICMTIDALPASVALALGRGAVIAVTTGGADATYAFRLGVDDVLTADKITRRVFEATLRAARARAQSRLGSVRSPVALADVTQGLALLTAALDQQVSAPLLAASGVCLALRADFDRLALTADRLERWAALVAPQAEMAAIAQVRAQLAPTSVHRKLHEVHVSLVRAETMVALLRDVSAVEAQRGCVAVSSVVAQLRELLLPHVESWASLRVFSDGECVAKMPRPAFVCIVSALVARAMAAIQSSGKPSGAIEIRVSEQPEQESTVLLEIFDNGDPEFDFGPEAGRSGSAGSYPADGLLGSIREHARGFGGEILVQSDAEGTTVQLLMPTLGADVVRVTPSAGERAETRLSEPPKSPR